MPVDVEMQDAAQDVNTAITDDCVSLTSSSDEKISTVEQFNSKRAAIVKRLKLHQRRVTNACLRLARLDRFFLSWSGDTIRGGLLENHQ